MEICCRVGERSVVGAACSAAAFSLAVAIRFRSHACAILLPWPNDKRANAAAAIAPVVICLSAAMRAHRTLIILTLTLNIVNMDVRLRRDAVADRCTKTGARVIEDDRILKRAIETSNYVFVGRITSVRILEGIVLYKVSLRRVVKGDLREVGVEVRFGTASSLRFSGASVLVESVSSCSRIRQGMHAVFFTEKRTGVDMRLAFVVEPIMLTLRSLEKIEAVVQGKIAF